jgi:hypothetical protein
VQNNPNVVMPGLDPGIHVETAKAMVPMTYRRRHVDGRVTPGHDDNGCKMKVARGFAPVTNIYIGSIILIFYSCSSVAA